MRLRVPCILRDQQTAISTSQFPGQGLSYALPRSTLIAWAGAVETAQEVADEPFF